MAQSSVDRAITSGRASPQPWAVLLLVLVLLIAPATVQAQPVHRTVRIEASQFQFDPGVIRVQRGNRVTIELVATDVVHGLYLDGYELEITAEPGQTVHLTFMADRAGTFRFRCSVSCGAMHPFMIGKLQVSANPLFWSALGLALAGAGAALVWGRRTS
ncbi:MAG: cupredoxin domain-containing protein [Candidatus Promineifilaceae bacterium]|nr:cupredoxin domain-containing protein [Candidatus Promineifilaceae bacterium]